MTEGPGCRASAPERHPRTPGPSQHGELGGDEHGHHGNAAAVQAPEGRARRGGGLGEEAWPSTEPLTAHQGVCLSQLLGEFSWLTEETLLRGFDVGFSGQLQCLVQHALSLLRPHVALLRVQQGDLLVVLRPGPGLTHLAHLSSELLPAFLSEAVGGESLGPGMGGMCVGVRGMASFLTSGPSSPSLCRAGAAGRQGAA